jgi:hypothetical protein
MALHAGFNTSIAVVVLREADQLTGGTYLAMQISQTVVLLEVAAPLVVATHGRRLGRGSHR